MVDKDEAPEKALAVNAESPTNWCNFCGFKTDSLTDYLEHSCVDVIKASGQTIVKTEQNACA